MTTGNSAYITPIVSRSAARDAIADALRLYVGRGRRYTVKAFSNGTGIKDRVIECAMMASDHPDSRPLKSCELLSAMKFLGAAFTTPIILLAEQGAFDLPGDEGVAPAMLAADSSEDSAKLARAAADGFEADRVTLREIGERMVTRGTQIVAMAA